MAEEVISDRVRLDISGPLARMVMVRANAGNALDLAMTQALRTAAQRIAAAPDLGCLLLAAEGRFFCVGGDLQEMNVAEPGPAVARVAETVHEALVLLAGLPFPVVTAVQGAAAGGGLGLALVGDVVLASQSARFRFAYTAAGLSPDTGVSWLLPRLVGSRRALAMALTNRDVTALEAERQGLISRVVADDELTSEVERVAQKLASGPIESLAATKRLLRSSAGVSLRDHLLEEATYISRLAATPDGREGVSAFLERRAPRFGVVTPDRAD